MTDLEELEALKQDHERQIIRHYAHRELFVGFFGMIVMGTLIAWCRAFGSQLEFLMCAGLDVLFSLAMLRDTAKARKKALYLMEQIAKAKRQELIKASRQ